jgi:hypothetical protein
MKAALTHRRLSRTPPMVTPQGLILRSRFG